MTTLCFLPVRVAVQLLALGRMFLAKLAIFWVFFSSPSAVLTGLLGHLVHTLLLDNNMALSIAIPLLATEMVVDTLLLVGVWRSARLCLVPWLALNALMLLGAAAGVVSLLVPIIIPVAIATSEEPHRTDSALREINRSLMIILLNMVLIFEMINISAVVRVMVDMRRKRRVSFSGNVEKKEVPPVSMYELPPPPPCYAEELEEVGSSSSSFEDIPTVHTTLMDNPNITIAEEGVEDVARESWNSLKFTFDKENFA